MKVTYPWDRWSDGRIHRIYQDQHYADVRALRGAAHSQGLKRRGRYSIRQEVRGFDDVLLIQFIKEAEAPRQQTKLPQLDIKLLTDILKLVHPDRHPGRENIATPVFQRVSDLRDEMQKGKN